MEAITLPVRPGVELRGFEPDDADTVYALVESERERLSERMSFIYWVASADDVRAFIEECRASERNADGNGIWVDGALAGTIGVTVDRFNAGDVGYWLGSAFEGRGLVTDSCRVLINHAFRVMGLHRVTIHAEPDNVRSCAVADRLGFTREAVLREACKVGDRYGDLAVYAMLEREWAGTGQS
jgi:ribosomal-protein-serine acetyltransferase